MNPVEQMEIEEMLNNPFEHKDYMIAEYINALKAEHKRAIDESEMEWRDMESDACRYETELDDVSFERDELRDKVEMLQEIIKELEAQRA